MNVTLKQAFLKRIYVFTFLVLASSWFAYDWFNRGAYAGFVLMVLLIIKQFEQIYSEVTGRKWVLYIPYAGQMMLGFLVIVLSALGIWIMRT